MIKTIFVFSYAALSMIILVPFGFIALIFHFMGLRKLMTWVISRLCQVWGRLLIKIIGAAVTVTGKENIPKEGGVCFVSNHSSYFDIVLMLAYCDKPMGFIAKKELLFIPFLNCWIFMLGGLFIDRKNIKKAVRTINRGVEKIKSGSWMLIYPEGHRSKGLGLLPFHPGSLKLATMAEAVIVPVAIKGSYDVFERNYRIKSVPVNVTFCESIDTSSLPAGERKLILSDKIFYVIKKQLEKDE